MSNRHDVKQMVEEEAAKIGCDVVDGGMAWVVVDRQTRHPLVDPRTGRPAQVFKQLKGSSFKNWRARIRRWRPQTQGGQPAAGSENLLALAKTWTTETMVKAAEDAGCHIELDGGLLVVTCDPDRQSYADLLKTHETDVTAYLKGALQARTTTEREIPMPTIATATIPAPAPAEPKRRPSGAAEDVATDARLVWMEIRDQVRAQGDQPYTHRGRTGLLWRGAFHNFVRTLNADWSQYYRKAIAVYLADTNNLICQSQHAKPWPRYWVADTYNDGGLTVTTTVPEPKPTPLVMPTTKPAPVAQPELPAVPSGTALEKLKAINTRLTETIRQRDEAVDEASEAAIALEEAQLRAVTAERERDELKVDLDHTTKLYKDAKTELVKVARQRDALAAYKDNVDAMFTALGGAG